MRSSGRFLKGGVLPWAFAAALLTLLVFLPARHNMFVLYDDYDYVLNNPHAEFGWESVKWCFTAVTVFNWHPLTMLSLAIDRAFYGVNPAGYHLTNILIHSSAAYLACLLFYRLIVICREKAGTSPVLCETPFPQLYPAAAAFLSALMFGIHPLRVQSVVWVTERKDVLFMFFFLLSLIMYLRFVKERSAGNTHSYSRSVPYLLSVTMLLLALLSKPAAVSLPLVLLLLDWYPLRRIVDRTTLVSCLTEKIPHAALAAIFSAITIATQQEPIKEHIALTFPSRILVAAKALLFYPAKTVWPSDLRIFYYHPGNVASSDLQHYAGFLALVVALSAALAVFARRCPQPLAVWLFCIITLLPSLGIIQVGSQYVADRYSYLPSLGLSLFWGGGTAWLALRLLAGKKRWMAAMLLCAAALQLAVYAWAARDQMRHWVDTESICSRLIDYYPEKSTEPYYFRAENRMEKGRLEEALADLDKAIEIYARTPENLDNRPQFHSGKAMVLYRMGRLPEALSEAEKALQLSRTPLPEEFMQMYDELRRTKK